MVRVDLQLQGLPGGSSCRLETGSAGPTAAASDRARCDLEAGWFATACIKTVIRSGWTSEITLTIEVHAGAEQGAKGSSNRGRRHQALFSRPPVPRANSTGRSKPSVISENRGIRLESEDSDLEYLDSESSKC